MKRILFSLIIIALIPLISWGAAFEPADPGAALVSYVGTTDQSITVSWDAEDAATYYEVHLVDEDTGAETPNVNARVTDPETIVKLPRSGHYMVKIRACNEKECSDWTESTDPTKALVNGQAKGWLLDGRVAAPGIPSISR